MSDFSRRLFLKQLALASAISGSARGLFAEELSLTPQMTEGPFYPDKMPLDTDNDLLVINDSITPAVGEITHLTGRILSAAGEPIRNAFVEIWQVDNNAVYLHTADRTGKSPDQNFQGYGRFMTDSKGNYYFRTVKPVPYPGRTPHIHFAVSKNGHRLWTTQLFVTGHEGNARDGIFQRIGDPKLQALVSSEFKPIPDSKIGELAASFDIIVGVTPEDSDDGKVHGGIAKSEIQERMRAGGPQRGPGAGPRPR
jgi:protocatechuate 3,4-dioxygenase beta subunit